MENRESERTVIKFGVFIEGIGRKQDDFLTGLSQKPNTVPRIPARLMIDLRHTN